jgi:predicted nucleic acid-binding protein
MSLVLDTGPIVALLNSGDPDHTRCAALLASAQEDIVIPAPVMVEVDYWCRKLLGYEALEVLVDDIASGAYIWFELGVAGMQRAMEIERRYQDLDLGYVDAAVVATCELFDEDRVVSLDRRHFGVVRPAHRPSLLVLPE